VGAGGTGRSNGPANNVLIDHVGGWTLAELDALDLYEKSYVQLDDGCLLVPPGASGLHQKVVSELTRGLDEAVGDRHFVCYKIEVLAGERDYFVPDVVVSRPDWVEPYRDYRLRAEDVALVVEVEENGTRSYDRYNKVRAYARVGIPAYWRVELEPEIVVVEYRLRGGSREYNTVGRHIGTLRTDFPGQVEIDLGAIAAVLARVFGRR
jgi:Uma2 family endonuclease